MDEQKKTRTLLIADPDREFLEKIRTEASAQKVPPVLARSGKEAQLGIADLTQPLLGIFVNAQIAHPSALSVARAVHHHRPSTPVFLTYDKNPGLTEKELHEFGIQKALAKPLTYSQMLEIVAPAFPSFDAEKAIHNSLNKSEPVDSEISAEDQNFVPIRSEDFLGGSISYFDIYVRFESGRYLKILQAGDSFSMERVENYRKKGVSHFFIRKESQADYLAYCERISSKLVEISNPKLVRLQVSQTLNYGEETLKFLRDQGMSEAKLQHAGQFIQNLNGVVKQLHPGKYPLLKGFLADIAAYEHGVGVTTIAALLVESLDITSSDPIETVGLSSLLHDIGLKALNMDCLDEDESKMTEYQRRIYRTHPTVGADFLKTVRGLKPVVVQAVAQHHERRSKKGFPLQIGAGTLSLVGEIVGLSNEFFLFIQKLKANPNLDMVNELQESIFNAFSSSLVTEFKKVFMFTDPKTEKSMSLNR